MQPVTKVIAIVAAVALIAVIGLIILSNSSRNAESADALAQQTAAEPEATPETAGVPEQADDSQPGEATIEAQEDEAQDIEMYEGALAGMTEEEIAAQALAEEQVTGEMVNGAEDAVD